MSDYTILLIDYDPRSIEHIRGLLSSAGHRVEVAKNGLAGLESFRDHKPSLVLVEAMLPKKHGFEVCQEIKASPEGKSIPVIIITAVYRGRKYRSQAFHIYKCDEYLEKPIEDDRLLEVVDGFLGGTAQAGSMRPTAPATSAESPQAPKVAESIDAMHSSEKARPIATPKTPKVRKNAPARPGGDVAARTDEVRKPVEPASEPPEEKIAELTEEDIMSTLDAIMPDDESAKTASG